MESAAYLYEQHDFGDDFDISGLRARAPLRAQFHYSGHILGAAGVEVYCDDGPEQRTVFYSSDTNLQNQTIIPGGDYPDQVDVLILESTMASDGDAELVTRRSEEKRLGEAIAAVLERDGSVLIPVFALGRAQEVIALIDRFKRRGVVDDDVPVYTAGSMRAVADLYDQTRYTTPRLDEDFEVFGVEQKRLPRSMSAKVAAIENQGIFVVASGMMFERTLSNALAQMMVDAEKHAIFFVGFAREDSPGGQLIEAAQSNDDYIMLDRLRGEQPLRCDVDRFPPEWPLAQARLAEARRATESGQGCAGSWRVAQHRVDGRQHSVLQSGHRSPHPRDPATDIAVVPLAYGCAR